MCHPGYKNGKTFIAGSADLKMRAQNTNLHYSSKCNLRAPRTNTRYAIEHEKRAWIRNKCVNKDKT